MKAQELAESFGWDINKAREFAISLLEDCNDHTVVSILDEAIRASEENKIQLFEIEGWKTYEVRLGHIFVRTHAPSGNPCRGVRVAYLLRMKLRMENIEVISVDTEPYGKAGEAIVATVRNTLGVTAKLEALGWKEKR